MKNFLIAVGIFGFFAVSFYLYRNQAIQTEQERREVKEKLQGTTQIMPAETKISPPIVSDIPEPPTEETFRQNIQTLVEFATDNVIGCLEKELGADVVEKIRMGDFTANEQIKTTVDRCYAIMENDEG